MIAFFTWLQMTPYAVWVRESLEGWPIVLTVHAFGSAIVVGVIAIMSLRLLGLYRTVPYASLNKFLTPLVRIGIAAQFLSGFSLFMTKSGKYVIDPMFVSKMVFFVTGVILTVYLQMLLKREAAAWDKTGKVSSKGALLGAAVGVAWGTVLILGRLTAYLTQIYYA